MKKQFFLIGAAAILGLGACNNDSTNSTANTDSTKTNNGDTSVQTTTTTTTTKTVHPISNFEHRTFYSLKTKKPVKLRMDTVNHYYVDQSTNQQPDYYYYDPASHDTFDYWGRRLNNALINNNGDYTIDETRITDNTTSVENSDTGTMNSTDKMNTGKTKTKQKDDVIKTKTKSK